MATPSEIGAQAEAAITAALVRAGKRVYLPVFGSDGRCDLVMEDETGLHRVQCKTSRFRRGAIVFRTCSNTNQLPKDYRDHIDLFAIYSPERDEVYLVPVGDVETRAGYLRVDQPANGQRARIRWARDYVLNMRRGGKSDGA
jgi:hypothetical protein